MVLIKLGKCGMVVMKSVYGAPLLMIVELLICTAGIITCIAILWKLMLPNLLLVIDISSQIYLYNKIGWHLVFGIIMIILLGGMSYCVIRIIIILAQIVTKLVKDLIRDRD